MWNGGQTLVEGSIGRLPQFARFIARNLPFVDGGFCISPRKASIQTQTNGKQVFSEIGDLGHNADPRFMPPGVLRVMRHPANQAGFSRPWDTLPLTGLRVMQGASRLLSLGGWSVPGRARVDVARRTVNKTAM